MANVVVGQADGCVEFDLRIGHCFSKRDRCSVDNRYIVLGLHAFHLANRDVPDPQNAAGLDFGNHRL